MMGLSGTICGKYGESGSFSGRDETPLDHPTQPAASALEAKQANRVPDAQSGGQYAQDDIGNENDGQPAIQSVAEGAFGLAGIVGQHMKEHRPIDANHGGEKPRTVLPVVRVEAPLAIWWQAHQRNIAEQRQQRCGGG